MEKHVVEAVHSDQRSVHSYLKNPVLILGLALSTVHCALYASVPDGYVVKVESATVYLDWGQSSGVAPGDEFNVYRQGAALKHPMTGEILGHAEEEVGQD